jgi:hypothetical protein
MGKLLTYLNADESVMPQDIIDAEKILIGMQEIYAESPDTPKKDFLGLAISEMTRTFIERVNKIKQP